MGFKTAGLPYYKPFNFLFRSFGLFPPFPLDNLIYACAENTEDGVIPDESKLAGDTRESVAPLVWVGNGSFYGELSETINLGTEHVIEFEANPTALSQNITGFTDSGTTELLSFINIGALRYRTSNGISKDFPTTLDGEWHKYVITRTPTTVSLSIDDGTPTTLSIGSASTFSLDTLFARGDLAQQLQSSCSYISLATPTTEYLFTPNQHGDLLTPQSCADLGGSGITVDYFNTYDGFLAVDYESGTVENDEHGWTLAQALGKNLLNNTVWQQDVYIDPSTGGFLVTSGTRTSYAILVESNTEYYATVDDRLTVRFEDLDGNYLGVFDTGGVSGTFTTPVNCSYLYIYYSRNGTDVDEVQLEVGTTPTTYEAWEGYYYDTDKLFPIHDGERLTSRYLTNDTWSKTECFAFVDDGAGGSEYGGLDYVGRIAQNIEYNKGSYAANGTDNYLDTGIVPSQSTSLKVWMKSNEIPNTPITFIGKRNVDGLGRFLIGHDPSGEIEIGWGGTTYATGIIADTEEHLYEINNGALYYDGEFIGGSVGTSIGTSNSDITIFARNDGGLIDRYANMDLLKAEITHNGETHIWDFNPNGDEAIVYTIDGVVQTPPTIQGTVTSGQWDTDEIIRATDAQGNPYTLLARAWEDMTSQPFYDYANWPDSVTALVAPVEDLVSEYEDGNKKIFISFDGDDLGCVLGYETAKSGDDLEKVREFLNFYEAFLVSDGAGGYEPFLVNDEPMNVRNPEVWKK